MASDPPSSILHPRRILVRGVNWLGDAVMTTPALLRLREKFPEARITLLTPEKLADLWKGHPAVDEIICLRTGESVLALAKKLRCGGFDLALVLPNSPRSALEVFFARIPQRIGYARPWRNFFLTQAVPARADTVKMHKRTTSEIKALIAADPHHASPVLRSSTAEGGRITHHASTSASAHQIHEYLHLVAALGANPEPIAPQLSVTPAEIDAARKKFGLENISRAIFGLNPGAEYGPAKRWPVGRFIAAAQQIQAQNNCVWLLFGGKSDAPISGEIASALHASPVLRSSTAEGGRITHHDLAGKTSLRELMALLKCCRVLLTNDTGPMHVAAALGTPVVVPFGSTSPELTGPGLPGDPRHHLLKANAPCSPCFLRACPIDFRCMNGIGIERVVEATIKS